MERKKQPPKPAAKKELKQRLLPGDFQRYLKQQAHYHQLNETTKELERPRGFFTIPEQLKGEQDIGEIDFLVFYFDSHEDYELVRQFFEMGTAAGLSHPKLNAELLAEVVRNAQTKSES